MGILRSVLVYISFAVFIISATKYVEKCTYIEKINAVDCNKVKIINLSVQCNDLAKGKLNVEWFRLTEAEFTILPKGITGEIKFPKIWLYNNFCLTNIEPLAFQSSMRATVFRVNYSPKLNGNVFQVTKEMTELNELELIGLDLHEVPEDVFLKNTKLREIYFSGNKIASFKALLPNAELITLSLSYNCLTNDSFTPDVFTNATKLKHLYLNENPKMTQLEETIFKRLLDNKTVVHVGLSNGLGSPYMVCNGQEWLCNKEGELYKYELLLQGYVCDDTKLTIFKYCETLKT